MNIMGKRIKEKRTEMGYTMEELGAKLGVQSSAVNKWEKGTVENIKRSTIETMAALFKCSPSWLMGWDSEEEERMVEAQANSYFFSNAYSVLGYEEYLIADICRELSKESIKYLLKQAKYLYFEEHEKEYVVEPKSVLDKRMHLLFDT